MIKSQITFNKKHIQFDSFKESAISIIEDFNVKMKSKGKEDIIATWKNEEDYVILELSQENTG